MKEMALQINARGSWGLVCLFAPAQLRAIQEAALGLAQAIAAGAPGHRGSNYSPVWRITVSSGRSPRVIAYLDPARGLKWGRAR